MKRTTTGNVERLGDGISSTIADLHSRNFGTYRSSRCHDGEGKQLYGVVRELPRRKVDLGNHPAHPRCNDAALRRHERPTECKIEAKIEGTSNVSGIERHSVASCGFTVAEIPLVCLRSTSYGRKRERESTGVVSFHSKFCENRRIVAAWKRRNRSFAGMSADENDEWEKAKDRKVNAEGKVCER